MLLLSNVLNIIIMLVRRSGKQKGKGESGTLLEWVSVSWLRNQSNK